MNPHLVAGTTAVTGPNILACPTFLSLWWTLLKCFIVVAKAVRMAHPNTTFARAILLPCWLTKTPFHAPITNCHAESWIGSLKRECLNHLFCFSLKHLDHVTQTYAQFYNTVRPHQGLGNVPIPAHRALSPVATGPPAGKIRRRQWLGGLLNHYYRKAA